VSRRVDSAKTALLSPQTMQTGQIDRRFPEETRRIAVPRASRGFVRQGLVATVADRASHQAMFADWFAKQGLKSLVLKYDSFKH
jgi:hypothetical protein